MAAQYGVAKAYSIAICLIKNCSHNESFFLSGAHFYNMHPKHATPHSNLPYKIWQFFCSSFRRPKITPTAQLLGRIVPAISLILPKGAALWTSAKGIDSLWNPFSVFGDGSSPNTANRGSTPLRTNSLHYPCKPFDCETTKRFFVYAPVSHKRHISNSERIALYVA